MTTSLVGQLETSSLLAPIRASRSSILITTVSCTFAPVALHQFDRTWQKLAHYVSQRRPSKGFFVATIAGCALAALPALGASTVTAAPALDYHPFRSSAARAAFIRENPCPANGNRRGTCPGYVVDYVKPLCAGGPDKPDNMQWQTLADAKIKDAEERRQCGAKSNGPRER